ncbi:MAG: hypothetical protein FJZ63_05985, partial [Chlamydiae bacterium]|nr:hypothetical protein [Chlamydiota bacterium]
QPIAGFFHHYYDVARERVGQLEWFKEVKGSSVVFGKAPLEKHSGQLKKLEVTKAIVIVQPGKVDKATKAAWKKENIELFQLERKSSDVLSLAELDAIVEEMRATKAKGGKSYIYSINGGGLDSALAVVAFLIKEENLSTAQAIEKLKQVEPALAFTDAEKGRLVGYEIAYKKSG